MNLSIVIKCSNDERIWRCLDSVDEKVEIIAAVTPNAKIEKELKRRKIRYAITPRGNISRTTNSGLALVSHQKIIIMDSDSYFEHGAIALIYEGLRNNLIVRPRIVFQNRGDFITKLISMERDLANRSRLVAYTPGLGIRKDLLPLIGGYYFDNMVRWADDAEFNWRIKKAGVQIFPQDKAIIYHDSITFSQEIRAAFQYGVGKRLSVDFSNRIPDEDLTGILKKAANFGQIKDTMTTFSAGEISLVIFTYLWNLAYLYGYNLQKYTGRYTVKE